MCPTIVFSNFPSKAPQILISLSAAENVIKSLLHYVDNTLNKEKQIQNETVADISLVLKDVFFFFKIISFHIYCILSEVHLVFNNYIRIIT